ncbi:MAG: lipopolysaccharide biosynthesis protein [Pseudomonadota bacterium]
MAALAMKTEEEEGTSLADIIDIVKRRGRGIGVSFAVGALATCVLALALPPTYRATGTILIEQQEIPTDLVRSTVTSYADERVQVISQRVMTTQNLLGIIRRYELYPSLQKRESREKVIERLRDDINFRMISADVVDPRTGVPRKATIAFAVSYDNASPDLAVKVANEITTLYLNENLTSRNQLAEDASSFLTTEGDRLSKHIAELEAKLAAFKEKNVNQLPELVQLNMSLLDRTQQQLRDAVTEQRSLTQQKVYLEAQLAQLKPNSVMFSDSGERILTSSDRLRALRSELASSRALYAADHPDIARLTREIAGLEGQEADQDGAADDNDVLRRLDAARAELGAAREKYSAEHPDVKNLERTVAALEAELAKPRTTVRARHLDAPDNPAFIQIQAQLSSIVNDQHSLAIKIASLGAQADEYEKKIAMSPVVEREYRELTRDYESAQLRYQELRTKQSEAQLAQNLETNRKGERFTLIEPPLPPEEPVSPNRFAVFIIGLILSAALAAGLAALREATDTSVRGRRDVEELGHGAPLALIPIIVTAAEVARGRRRWRFAAGGAMASAVVALLGIHLFFRPLDTLWFIVLRRLGI